MKTALVVDDSRATRILLGKILRELGYEVLEAANGREALAAVAQARPALQLVLADWYMPELDGVEMIKQLRANPRNNGIKVLMVTSECDLNQITTALLAGANEYVMKPFTREIVEEKLQLVGIRSECCG